MTDPINAISESVKSCCEGLEERTDINTSFSGTTLVLAVIHERTIYACNVGDSRMILVQSDTDPSGSSPTEEDDNLAVTVLTIDHGLDIPDECARVEKSGGIVATLPGDPD
eukprot:960316_1